MALLSSCASVLAEIPSGGAPARKVTASALPVCSSSAVAAARMSSRSLPPSPRLLRSRRTSLMPSTLQLLAHAVKLTDVSQRALTLELTKGADHGNDKDARGAPGRGAGRGPARTAEHRARRASAAPGDPRRDVPVTAHRGHRQHDPEHGAAYAGPRPPRIDHRPA